MSDISVGAFYNPHLGAELARATGIDHLAMADPPAPSDSHWSAIKQRYTLLLHDYLGQLSEPLDERSNARARSLAAQYRAVKPAAWLGEFPLERVVELHVAGVEQDADLQGPWIAPAAPSDEMLDFMALAVTRCPSARAVTFDAFSPSLTPEVLLSSVERIRRAL